MFEEMVLEDYFELESMVQNLIRRTHFQSARLVFKRARSILNFKFCDSKMYFFARFCNIFFDSVTCFAEADHVADSQGKTCG